jgi:hypothetical protein
MSIFNRLFANILGLFAASVSHKGPSIHSDPILGSGRKSLFNPSSGGSFNSGTFSFYEINSAHRRNHRRGIYNRRG